MSRDPSGGLIEWMYRYHVQGGCNVPKGTYAHQTLVTDVWGDPKDRATSGKGHSSCLEIYVETLMRIIEQVESD